MSPEERDFRLLMAASAPGVTACVLALFALAVLVEVAQHFDWPPLPRRWRPRYERLATAFCLGAWVAALAYLPFAWWLWGIGRLALPW